MTTTTLAAVSYSPDRPLAIEAVRLDPPGPGEVQVRVAATAICHSDISFFAGSWGAFEPAVFGHETAGVVSAVGAGVSTVVPGDSVVVTNIGGVAVEWQHLHDTESTFYLWHSLGLATSIAFGMALSWPGKKHVVFEGDGSLLMNLGGLTTVAEKAPGNLVIVVFDNEAHESPGGYRTATAGRADLQAIAGGAGIANAHCVRTLQELDGLFGEAMVNSELCLIVAKVETGTRDVPYPTMDARENKYRFIRWVERERGIRVFQPPGHVTRMHG